MAKQSRKKLKVKLKKTEYKLQECLRALIKIESLANDSLYKHI